MVADTGERPIERGRGERCHPAMVQSLADCKSLGGRSRCSMNCRGGDDGDRAHRSGDADDRAGPPRHGRGDRRGRVLTNAHNLRDRPTQVAFADERIAQAEVLGADPEGDLAVLAVDTTGALSPNGPRRPPRPARSCSAPPRRQGLRVTFGVVSGVDREFRGHAVAGSPGAWNTPRRLPEDHPADRSSTSRDSARHQHQPHRRRVLPRYPHRRRADLPGGSAGRGSFAGPPPTRCRRGAVVRRPPPAAFRRAPRARWFARPRRRRGLAGRGRRRHDGRPHRLRQRRRRPRCGRPVGGPRRLEWRGNGLVELGIVRGADELTIQVTFDDGAAQER